jgi:hypothetical protein
VIAAGIVLPIVGFVLFFTDRGSRVVFTSIGITMFLLFWILFWFGLGLAGILRTVGTALIWSGLVCLVFRPFAAVACLLIGIACRFAAFRIVARVPKV